MQHGVRRSRKKKLNARTSSDIHTFLLQRIIKKITKLKWWDIKLISNFFDRNATMSCFEVHKHCPRNTSSKIKFSESLQSGTQCHRNLILSVYKLCLTGKRIYFIQYLYAIKIQLVLKKIWNVEIIPVSYPIKNVEKPFLCTHHTISNFLKTFFINVTFHQVEVRENLIFVSQWKEEC